MSRIPFGKAKSKQLHDLLCTKFRNKFKVCIKTEEKLIQMIDEDVDTLLTSGKAYEK